MLIVAKRDAHVGGWVGGREGGKGISVEKTNDLMGKIFSDKHNMRYCD